MILFRALEPVDETMDSSFYLLPKDDVPPSITMFSFKNVTLKKFRSMSSAVSRISFCSQRLADNVQHLPWP